MLTGSKYGWCLFFCVCFLSAGSAFAQTRDSVGTNSPFTQFWTKPLIIPKLGVGVQDRLFFEMGVQWHTIYRHPLTLISKGPYCTVDLFIKESNVLVGPKLGYEFTAGLLGAAFDVTYFMDHNYNSEGANRKAWVATPKVGLSILGFADLFYGYSIPISEERITSISRNRFSLVFNINTYYFDLKDAPRKR
jgi:hypothetical protein